MRHPLRRDDARTACVYGSAVVVAKGVTHCVEQRRSRRRSCAAGWRGARRPCQRSACPRRWRPAGRKFRKGGPPRVAAARLDSAIKPRTDLENDRAVKMPGAADVERSWFAAGAGSQAARAWFDGLAILPTQSGHAHNRTRGGTELAEPPHRGGCPGLFSGTGTCTTARRRGARRPPQARPSTATNGGSSGSATRR